MTLRYGLACRRAGWLCLSTLVSVLVVAPRPAFATCPPGCPSTGGGPPETDCHAEFASTALRPNFPPFNPAAPEPQTEVRCFDGDAGCDTDGVVNDVCVFDVDVCLRNDDAALPECAPSDVTGVTVAGAEADADLAALQNTVDALLPATSNVCTSGQTLGVPLAAADAKGGQGNGRRTVELEVRTVDGAVATDRLELVCVPHGWPSHGYSHANHRNNPRESTINPQNAASLRVKWQLDLTDPEGRRSASVTSTPTLGNGFVYFSVWSGDVCAVDPDDGEVAWTYPSGSSLGMNSATLTADERLLVGSRVAVHCVNAITGQRLWMTDLRTKPQDLIWAAPQVANGRVFIGVASTSDAPCTPGRMVALDLDTGDVLWSLRMVPERVCAADTGVECEEDSDCPSGLCVEGCGAGVTATVAIDPSGEYVYMTTVGSFTYPSIGDSDSILKLEAETGRVVWRNRLQPPEQFGACRDDTSIDCGTDADCGGGECVKKRAYHDFGFVNGPLLAETSDGAGGTRSLVVSGGKEGTLYGLDTATGEVVWKNEVLPTPVTPGFGGFGLFNGAIGFADGRVFAALNETNLRPRPPMQPEHLMAFNGVDGGSAWSSEIGVSWSHVGLAGGVLFTGTLTEGTFCVDDGEACESAADCATGSCADGSVLFAYDASNGTPLKQFYLPASTASGAATVDGSVYVGYGIFGGVGGVMALHLATCTGDCNSDGTVRVNELTLGVGIALGSTPVDACPGFDEDADGVLSIDELIDGVDNGLYGCP